MNRGRSWSLSRARASKALGVFWLALESPLKNEPRVIHFRNSLSSKCNFIPLVEMLSNFLDHLSPHIIWIQLMSKSLSRLARWFFCSRQKGRSNSPDTIIISMYYWEASKLAILSAPIRCLTGHLKKTAGWPMFASPITFRRGFHLEEVIEEQRKETPQRSCFSNMGSPCWKLEINEREI